MLSFHLKTNIWKQTLAIFSPFPFFLPIIIFLSGYKAENDTFLYLENFRDTYSKYIYI